MSENKPVYEIAKMMNDTAAIQNDLAEAAYLVRKMLEEKYIARIGGILNGHYEDIRSNPSREIKLIQAFKEFMPEDSRASADRLVDTMFMVQALTGARNEYYEKSGQPRAAAQSVSGDASVHPDGVYDVDGQCEKGRRTPPASSIMPLLLLMI